MFRTAYGDHQRVSIKFPEVTPTEQHHKDRCDINKIMAKFIRTGTLDHARQHGGQYGDIDPIEFHDAMNTVAEAWSMFEELPSPIRATFRNNPADFLEFVQNPDNQEEMRKMGLTDVTESASLPTIQENQNTDSPEKSPGTPGVQADDATVSE